ncbi:catalase A [Linderina macrospora]|uniref:Catalase A n=1 Tax=Linderina macrospora TaxID=4868 RepID=A0ACC1IY92_9FUNG|nr:catalase A [Linderina macrospora]
MTFDNFGGAPNYEPNSFGGPAQNPATVEVASSFAVTGNVGRFTYELCDADFEQPRALYNLLSESERTDLVNNLAGTLAPTPVVIQKRTLAHLYRIDENYGARIEAVLKELGSGI